MAPKGIIKVEICSASGQLATNKCVELVENKETGEKVERRTTYFEIATDAQAPKDGCEVHGGPNLARPIAKANPANGDTKWPRPVAVIDVSAHPIIPLKAATVLGDDPYNSAQAATNVAAMGLLAGHLAPMDSTSKVPKPAEGGTEPEIRRAEPVRPLEQVSPVDSSIKLDPPRRCSSELQVP